MEISSRETGILSKIYVAGSDTKDQGTFFQVRHLDAVDDVAVHLGHSWVHSFQVSLVGVQWASTSSAANKDSVQKQAELPLSKKAYVETVLPSPILTLTGMTGMLDCNFDPVCVIPTDPF